jgi:alpha/beta superfamily hydrolase
VAELEAVIAGLAEPKRLVLIEAQDHFFAGALEELEATVAGLP